MILGDSLRRSKSCEQTLKGVQKGAAPLDYCLTVALFRQVSDIGLIFRAISDDQDAKPILPRLKFT